MKMLNNLKELEQFLGQEGYVKFRKNNIDELRNYKIDTILRIDNNIVVEKFSDDLLKIQLNDQSVMFPLSRY